MRYHCTFCTFHGTTDEVDVYEGIDGYLVHCPNCRRLLAELPYDEAGDEVEALLPSADQCRYLTHLCQKQVAKLDGAKQQLLDLMAKTKGMLARAQERDEP